MERYKGDFYVSHGGTVRFPHGNRMFPPRET